MRTEPDLLSRLRRGTVEVFVLRAAGAGLLFFMHTALSRAVGPSGYGTFSFALALAAVLAAVVPLGWPTALMRFIAQYVEQERWGLLKGAMRRAYQVTLLCAALAALVLCAVSLSYPLPPAMVTSVRFAALLLPFVAVVELRRRALQALQRPKASTAPEEIALPLLVISGVYLFAVTGASGALLVYAGAAFAAFLLGSALLLRSMPASGRLAKPEFQTRAWMIVALPMVFGDFSLSVMSRTDVLILGAVADMEAVGVYSAANRIAILNTFVLMAANTLAAPMMAAAFYGNRPQQVRTIMRGAMAISTLGALPLFVVMVSRPEFLLGFFGPEFAGGGLLLRILALGYFVNAATGPVGYALLMTGRERAFARTMAIVAVANVVGHLVAIPAFGAVGAAVVTASSAVVLNGSMYWQVRRSGA